MNGELLRIRVSAEDMKELLQQEVDELVRDAYEDPDTIALQEQLEAAQINAGSRTNAKLPERNEESSVVKIDRPVTMPPALRYDKSWIDSVEKDVTSTKKARRRSAPINLGFLARGVVRGTLSHTPPLRPSTNAEDEILDESISISKLDGDGEDTGSLHGN